MPQVDVVVPTLNAAAALPATLRALAAHDGRIGLTVTVCDGGSRDSTVAVARGAGAAVVASEAGRGRQLATGAAAGHAPWLLFLHADTRPGAGWVEALLTFTADATNRDRAGYFRLRFASADPRARRVERLASWRCRRWGLPYGDQGLLIGRAFYDALGGYPALPLMEDVALVRRIGRDRLVALAADAITSPRRYEREGWLLRPARNLLCLALYASGVPPHTILRLYGP